MNRKFNLYLLGEFYIIFDVPFRDISQAVHYYSLVANQNSLEILIKHGNMYYGGGYVLQTINKAIRYCSLAANHNNSNAFFQLGNISKEMGKYLPRGIDKAIHFFQLASYYQNPQI